MSELSSFFKGLESVEPSGNGTFSTWSNGSCLALQVYGLENFVPRTLCFDLSQFWSFLPLHLCLFWLIYQNVLKCHADVPREGNWILIETSPRIPFDGQSAKKKQFLTKYHKKLFWAMGLDVSLLSISKFDLCKLKIEPFPRRVCLWGMPLPNAHLLVCFWIICSLLTHHGHAYVVEVSSRCGEKSPLCGDPAFTYVHTQDAAPLLGLHRMGCFALCNGSVPGQFWWV